MKPQIAQMQFRKFWKLQMQFSEILEITNAISYKIQLEQ